MLPKKKIKSKKRSVTRLFLAGCGTIVVLLLAFCIWVYFSLFSGQDAIQTSPHYPFKSVEAKEKYLDHYEKRSQKWPVAYEDQMIQTSQGETFVRISGFDDAPPLVLIPSAGATSLLWTQNVEMLADRFKIYAIDNIYDFGRSRNTRPFETPNDLMLWLDELFDTLALENNINLMGLSYGGWISSQYVLHAPERLHKAVLIAPAATIIQLPGEWAWRGILSAIPNKFIMRKVMVEWAFKDLAAKDDAASQTAIDDLMNDAILAIKSFKFKMPIHPTVLSDHELESISIPTLFLVGENEVIYSAGDAIARLNLVAPQIKTEIIPNAGHDLTVVQSELVNTKVIEFLLDPMQSDSR
ncbi:MAG: alpha/beta hydrolase [candidate division KSB1 bacterium]|jgi:pimeloyl-ACP methyl ester carboxylesterase|nr:alpha/beta hydrolase [candidate division KSB1 bacterium]